MYRLIILFLFSFCLALSSAKAADYEINLSVLNALGQDNVDQELPMPDLETPKPLKKATEKVAKKTVKKTDKKVVKKAIVKKETSKQETSKKEAVKEVLAPVVVSEAVKENKTEITENKEIKEDKITVVEPVKEQKTEAPKAEVVSEIVAPLVPVTKQPVAVEEKTNIDDGMDDKSTSVSFADNSDELNEEIIRRLKLTIEKLGGDYSGKFLIEAYNYDNDGGIFSRKRLSLNRAVAVRSYLLGEGYKSFSIKIINTEDASLRNNVLISY